MEQTDLDLIEAWKNRNPLLKKLWDDHQEMERRLEVFNKRVYMTTEEQVEQKLLKKKKLQGRTQMERILMEIRKTSE